eukprot:SAG31_NODE_2970_length_4839_cov_2.684810_2_plen_303_part_00
MTICFSCLSDYCTGEISLGKLYVKCPMCPRSLQTREVRTLVPQSKYSNLVKRIKEMESKHDVDEEIANVPGLQIRLCPDCNAPIEKNEGCDSMDCWRCGKVRKRCHVARIAWLIISCIRLQKFSWSSASVVKSKLGTAGKKSIGVSFGDGAAGATFGSSTSGALFGGAGTAVAPNTGGFGFGGGAAGATFGSSTSGALFGGAGTAVAQPLCRDGEGKGKGKSRRGKGRGISIQLSSTADHEDVQTWLSQFYGSHSSWSTALMGLSAASLRNLTDEQLVTRGLRSWGERRKLLKAVREALGVP